MAASGAIQHGTLLEIQFTNDKRACSTHIDDIIVAQFSCEDAWAKRPVSANIDTSEENNERHAGIIRNPLTMTIEDSRAKFAHAIPEIRMNSLKSRAMNCGPLSEMIRGVASPVAG
jgi:hypothetical protein